jgi:GNAT superfamily N-acetyltransferase
VSLLINRALRDIPGLTTIAPASHGGPAWAYLHPGDFRARTTTWVRQIVIHTTGGNWPQPVLRGAGPGGHARDIAEMWAGADHGGGERVHSGAQLIVDTNGDVICLCDLARTVAFHAEGSNPWSIGIEMCTLSDGSIFQATLTQTARLVDALCYPTFPIPRQMPRGPYRNAPLRRMELGSGVNRHNSGGENCVGWVDEFTSVVDRQVAQIGSHAVAKYIRKRPDAQFVAVGCHFDVIDWLQPDWVLEPATMAFTWRSLQRRPGVNVEIKRCSRSLWSLFAPYHYMTAELSASATCFALYVGDRPVAFAGILPLPVSRGSRAGEAIHRVSRVVTLPDWQGLGLAFVLIDSLGAAYAACGSRFRNYPAHPAFVRSSARSAAWRQLKQAGVHSAGNSAGNMGGRPCAVFEYIGPAMDECQARRLIARG